MRGRQLTVRRLLHDLREVLDCPLADAVALPSENDLYLWHGNVRGAGPLAGCVLHFKLLFTDQYPEKGPSIRMYHPIPHVSLHRLPGEAEGDACWEVRLWECAPSWQPWDRREVWHPSYSVHSILILLHAFLLAEDLLYDTRQVSVAGAREAAKWLRAGLHNGTVPHPPFPTQQQLAAPPRLRRCTVHAPQVRHVPEPAAVVRAGGPDGEGFSSALGKTVRVAADTAARPAAGAGAAAWVTSGRFGVLDSLQGDAAEEATNGAPDAANAVKAGRTEIAAGEAEAEQEEEGASAQLHWLLDASILERSAAEVVREVLQAAAGGPRWDPPLAPRPWTGSGGEGWGQPAGDKGLAMGPSFSMLPADALHSVLSRLPARDVAALGSTCRALQAACSAGTLGTLWRDRLRRAYPHSPLHADTAEGWHTAFLLEAHHAAPWLRCYFTHGHMDDTVLGLPLTWDSEEHDPQAWRRGGRREGLRVASHAPMSVVLALDLRFRQADGGCRLRSVLPLYLCQDHFERALQDLPRVLQSLAPHLAGYRGAGMPHPSAWLEVLPTLMCEVAVGLMQWRHGDAEIDRALDTFVSLHRLLLALCEHYGLWDAAERRVTRFLSSGAEQARGQTSNLGNFIPLLAVSRRHDWREALGAVFQEALVRNVFWIASRESELIPSLRGDPGHCSAVDRGLLGGALAACDVSLKLFAFHAAFMALVAHPQGWSISKVMFECDSLYGRPGRGTRAAFHAAVRRIASADTWEKVLAVMGQRPQRPEQVTALLRRSWGAAAERGTLKPWQLHYRSRPARWRDEEERCTDNSSSPHRAAEEARERIIPKSQLVLSISWDWHVAPFDLAALVYGRPPGGLPRAGADPDPRPIRLLATVDRLRPAFGRSDLAKVATDYRSRHRGRSGRWEYPSRVLRKTVPTVRLVESVDPEEVPGRRGHGGRGAPKKPPPPNQRVQKLMIVLDDLDPGVTSIVLVASARGGATLEDGYRPGPTPYWWDDMMQHATGNRLVGPHSRASPSISCGGAWANFFDLEDSHAALPPDWQQTLADWGFDEDVIRECRANVPGIAPTQADREAHSSIVLARLWRGPVAGEWEWEPLRALCGGRAGDYAPILDWIEGGGLPAAKPDFFQMDRVPRERVGIDRDAEGSSGWR